MDIEEYKKLKLSFEQSIKDRIINEMRSFEATTKVNVKHIDIKYVRNTTIGGTTDLIIHSLKITTDL